MWEVLEHRRVSRQLGALPVETLKRYEKWKGHRSSRLSEQYRVIHEVEASGIVVLVVEVTAHDYRRR